MLVRAGEVELNVARSPTEPRPGMPTVVCVHGFVIDEMSSFYFTLAGALAEVADVICYDLRGHGRSPEAASGHTVRDQVGDLCALVDALGVEGPVHVVGFSYGAAVALTAALSHPDRVASLVVIDGNYPVPGWGAELGMTMEMVAQNLSVESVMARLEITSRRRAERLRTRIDQLVNHSTLRRDVIGEPTLAEADLRALHQPVLCCYGDESDLLDRGRRLADLLPDVDYHELPGVGHRVIAERSAELGALIVGWLHRHAPGPGPAGGRVHRADAQVP